MMVFLGFAIVLYIIVKHDKISYYSLVSTATWTFHFAVIVQWYMDAIKTIIYIPGSLLSGLQEKPMTFYSYS